MWVFGYGSLMWDGWEHRLDGIRRDRAKLINYHRAFNKKSVRNWGTRDNPGPTLGLEPEKGADCMGAAFEFPDSQKQPVLDYLKQREGRSFNLVELEVILNDGATIQAFTPVNDRTASTYIGDVNLKERAEMARAAGGSDGRCIDYVRGIRDKLRELSIRDEYVEEFWEACNLYGVRSSGASLAA